MVYNTCHPQIQGMVSCKLCEKCYNVKFASFYIFRGESWKTITSSFTSQAHVLKCKNEGIGDELPI